MSDSKSFYQNIGNFFTLGLVGLFPSFSYFGYLSICLCWSTLNNISVNYMEILLIFEFVRGRTKWNGAVRIEPSLNMELHPFLKRTFPFIVAVASNEVSMNHKLGIFLLLLRSCEFFIFFLVLRWGICPQLYKIFVFFSLYFKFSFVVFLPRKHQRLICLIICKFPLPEYRGCVELMFCVCSPSAVV